jgi:thymidylate kinase
MRRFIDCPVFIVVEGLPGCNTTELVRALAPAFGDASARLPTRHSVEYDSDASAMSRHLDDAAFIAKTSDAIRSILDDGQAVVLDRYWPSFTACHRANGSPLWLSEVTSHIVPAHITIYLVASLEMRRQRIEQSPDGGSEADRRTLDPNFAEELHAGLTVQMSHDFAGEVVLVEAIKPPEILAAAFVERFAAGMKSRWKHCVHCGHRQDKCQCPR